MTADIAGNNPPEQPRGYSAGHGSLDTTLIYTHLTPISEEKARETLQRLHGALATIKAWSLLCTLAVI